MTNNNSLYFQFKQNIPLWCVLLFSFTLMSCGGSSSSKTGYVQLYNLSPNAPGIYLTIDKYDDDDYVEQTYSAISFTNTSSRFSYEPDTYDIELAWQNEFGNQSDLEIVYQEQLKISNESVEFIVISEDIKAPQVLVYELPVRDDDELNDDSDDDLFNIKVLNMHNWSAGLDFYYSEADETFNEAQLLNKTSYTELSENQKLDQDSYIFYITSAGESDVLFTSEDISFPYASEYIIVIRANTGVGSSPFLIDVVSTSTTQEFTDSGAEASYRVYNGIVENELLPGYEKNIDFHINSIDETPEITSLGLGEFSPSTIIESGDYSMNVVSSENQTKIISNHLLPLNENTDRTIFLYLLEEAVDEDGDGDIDENGDGYIDELEITLNSLVVTNSTSDNIYSHAMTVINLIDQDEIIDDFSSVKVYFVLNDEIIETASQSLTTIFAVPTTAQLLNNTYSIYAIGSLDSSNIVLASTQLTLDEDSTNQFIILEKDADSATGYKMTFTNQSDN